MAEKNKATKSSAITEERKFTGLKRFNLIMGFLHLVQGIFMIVVSNDTTYPIFTNYLSFDIATRSLKPDTQLFYELPFGVAVAFFLLISAVAHFLGSGCNHPDLHPQRHDEPVWHHDGTA